MRWIAREHQFNFPRPTIVMGIVNTTPDSFTDGGRFLDADAAGAHALRLASQGAEILDIGGESTRPGSANVSEQEELDRVIPVIERLAKRPELVLSIDTQKPSVAREALAAGASLSTTSPRTAPMQRCGRSSLKPEPATSACTCRVLLRPCRPTRNTRM